jgi:hypothetical protein
MRKEEEEEEEEEPSTKHSLFSTLKQAWNDSMYCTYPLIVDYQQD